MTKPFSSDGTPNPAVAKMMGEMDKVWQTDLVSIAAATDEIRDRLLGRGEFAQDPCA